MPPKICYFNDVHDWLIIGAVVVVLFGGSKIPEVAKGLGDGIRDFKKSVLPQSRFDDTSERRFPGTDITGSEKRDAFIVALLVLTISILVVLLFTV